MKFGTRIRRLILGALAVSIIVAACGVTPSAAQTQKPNILFIMGDDIGWMQPSIYHGGLMVGETPNIDRIGQEGAKFMTYYAEQSCTAGRNAFFTGMNPLRTGMIPPQLPGSPTYLKPGTPTIAWFLRDRLRRYCQGGKRRQQTDRDISHRVLLRYHGGAGNLRPIDQRSPHPS